MPLLDHEDFEESPSRRKKRRHPAEIDWIARWAETEVARSKMLREGFYLIGKRRLGWKVTLHFEQDVYSGWFLTERGARRSSLRKMEKLRAERRRLEEMRLVVP